MIIQILSEVTVNCIGAASMRVRCGYDPDRYKLTRRKLSLDIDVRNVGPQVIEPAEARALAAALVAAADEAERAR